MRLYSALERFLMGLIGWLWTRFIWVHEIRNILSKRRLYRQVTLTQEQKRQIDALFRENYGRRFPYAWHRLYQSYTGRFDPRYMPEILFTTRIAPRSCTPVNINVLADKQMLPVLFDGRAENVRVPRTLLTRVGGRFYDSQRRLVPRERAEAWLALECGQREVVVKVSVNSSSGRGVRMLTLEDGRDARTGEDLHAVFDAMGGDLVVQERLVPHPALAKLYPDAINTFRVMTYRVGDALKVAPVLLRIGQGGSEVDNAHAGGMFIAVDDDGQLGSEAFTEGQKRYRQHPDTGVVFEGYRVPFMPQLRRAALELHRVIPRIDVASWDLTVDADGQVVLVEINLRSQAIWMAQMAHGKSFYGEDTEAMLRLARSRRRA